MKTKIYKNYEDFMERENREENGVSENFASENPDYEEENTTNTACWNCTNCKGCVECEGCVECKGCVECVECVEC